MAFAGHREDINNINNEVQNPRQAQSACSLRKSVCAWKPNTICTSRSGTFSSAELLDARSCAAPASKRWFLNAAPNKIAFKKAQIFRAEKSVSLINQLKNVPEHVVKRDFIPHLRAPGPGKQATPLPPSVTELRLAPH